VTTPIIGYKRNPPPILKKKKTPIKVTKIPNSLAPLELLGSTQDRYMEDELQRIENTLSKAQSPKMTVSQFTVRRELDGSTATLGTTTDTLLTLIQDLKDSGVIS
jgi:hypothetical protein